MPGQVCISGQVDNAHAAAANLPDNLIAILQTRSWTEHTLFFLSAR
jgi:hypothetical protein